MAKDDWSTVRLKSTSKAEGQTDPEHRKTSNSLWDGSGAGNQGT